VLHGAGSGPESGVCGGEFEQEVFVDAALVYMISDSVLLFQVGGWAVRHVSRASRSLDMSYDSGSSIAREGRTRKR